MDEWQDIETAPRDGTRILGYRKVREDSCIYETWWEPDYMQGDYGVTVGGWDDDWDMAREPTHWMHLPKEPTQ